MFLYLFMNIQTIHDYISVSSKKKEQEAQIVTQKREKELKLHAQFEKFMQTSGVKKLS